MAKLLNRGQYINMPRAELRRRFMIALDRIERAPTAGAWMADEYCIQEIRAADPLYADQWRDEFNAVRRHDHGL